MKHPCFRSLHVRVLLFVALILLVVPGGIYNARGEFEPAYGLASKGKKYQKEDGLLLWYRDEFTKAGFEKVFTAELDPKMKGFADAFDKGLNAFNKWRCSPKSISTAPSVSTTTSTTLTPCTLTSTPCTPTSTPCTLTSTPCVDDARKIVVTVEIDV